MESAILAPEAVLRCQDGLALTEAAVYAVWGRSGSRKIFELRELAEALEGCSFVSLGSEIGKI